tara:strand:- start:1367 stop:2002 length:636 start_codon:yes stop_codon:yes gene_type:complete
MAEYRRDINDNDILYGSSEDHQYMMEWEKKYMEDCIDYMQPYGDVLEIGFGMGYSATQIMKWNPKSYTVLEPDPTVYKKAVEWSKNYSNAKVVFQPWPNIDGLGKYDCFFYDPYLEGDISDISINNCTVTFFLLKSNKELAKKQSRYSFYCSSQGNNMEDWCRNVYDSLSKLPDKTQFGIKLKQYDTEVPENCNYCKTGWLHLPTISIVKP